ncbi:Armadillo repeat-containing protein 3 [Taenia crassiceps]|uniref:Armadillo repeat-containing protein 3 n=1 Tax=Taenia crassiceps TaxID=6207 RepID=A0ABR4QJ66_9CEST
MSFESNRRHLIQSELYSRLISLFEKPLSFKVLESLLKLLGSVFESPMALNVSNIATVVLWISHFIFGDHEVGDGDTSSISKTPRIRSVKRTTKFKRRDNCAAAGREEVSWTSLQMSSCRILQKVAQSDKCLALLMANGIDQKLMELIGTNSADINVEGAAAKALSCLVRNEAVRMGVTLSGGVNKFVRLLESDNMEIRSTALAALGSLLANNPLACREVAQVPHLLPQLLSGLKACEADVLNTLVIIHEITRNGEILEQLYAFGVIPAVVNTLSSSSIRIQTKSLSLLPSLLSSDCGIASFQQAGGIEKLVKCLKSPQFEVRRAATATVGLLAHDKVAAEILYEAGPGHSARNVYAPHRVLEELYSTQPFEDQCSASLVDIAIKSILNSNPILKFAMTGVLDFSDITGRVFYDVGRLKATDRLKSLLHYARVPVNETRPVWLLNITEAWTEDPSGFSLPYDLQLRHAIQVCATKIKESTNLYHNARALAIEIANFFGGPMTREEAYSSIKWQEVAQYRCHYNTNIVPVSLLSRAGYRHRALLFKFIIDKVGIPCSCVCGEYQIAYNVICIQGDTGREKKFVVDLMSYPGALYATDSKEAYQYCSF